MPQTATEHDFEQLLAGLGRQVHVYFMGNAAKVLCVPVAWKPIEPEIVYLYVTHATCEVDANFLHIATGPMTELEHMRILHKAGYMRAAILAVQPLRTGLVQIQYHHNKKHLKTFSPRPSRPIDGHHRSQDLCHDLC